MKPTVLLARATTPDGRPLTLHEHDGTVSIRIDGVELMSTRQHHSEERLAELACGHIADEPRARVLVGGLGLGFTLRAALGRLRPDAVVTVVELVPAVVRWNADPGYGLGADALGDPRVDLVEGDVADVLALRRRDYDAVILDVDNGACGLTSAGNDRLYTPAGLAAAKAALRPGGCLAVWSATDDPAFAERMRRAGLTVATERARTHDGGRGGWNTLFIGRDEPAPDGRRPRGN